MLSYKETLRYVLFVFLIALSAYSLKASDDSAWRENDSPTSSLREVGVLNLYRLKAPDDSAWSENESPTSSSSEIETSEEDSYHTGILLPLSVSKEKIFLRNYFPFNMKKSYKRTLILGTKAWKKSVEDQGKFGASAILATIDALKFVHESILLSPDDLLTKTVESVDSLVEGISIGEAMETARNMGVIDQESKLTLTNSAAVNSINKDNEILQGDSLRGPVIISKEEDLLKYAFKDIRSIFHPKLKLYYGSKVPLIVDALAKTRSPVVISVAVESTGWPKFGVIEEKIDGPAVFQAITLYGYEAKTDLFFFKNTLGIEWGYRGHGRMRGEFVEDYAREGWVGIGTKFLASDQEEVIPVIVLPNDNSGDEQSSEDDSTSSNDLRSTSSETRSSTSISRESISSESLSDGD